MKPYYRKAAHISDTLFSLGRSSADAGSLSLSLSDDSSQVGSEPSSRSLASSSRSAYSVSTSPHKKPTTRKSGRGGLGNITTLSAEASMAAIPSDDDSQVGSEPCRRSYASSSPRSEYSKSAKQKSGRGGLGNITDNMSPDEPLRPQTAEIMAAQHVAQERYEAGVRQAHADAHPQRYSGRGGSGNIHAPSKPKPRARSVDARPSSTFDLKQRHSMSETTPEEGTTPPVKWDARLKRRVRDVTQRVSRASLNRGTK
ncbi:hypothetical protein CONPUDRAFT_166202 [Coniophora puteana RWD-64-598 SS2]|uniref:Uncharacterized protein n=1 Tax=Coniophora puteana (strain RWD-64-598) TaxID=741705 RepID=A0A5M3MNW4_CONPW|nr:uncharacterized protein CONPUDRAFT_166202 [Coniophora puteana RWD-64-598 SS2]EIW80803.1 hypothetical protein CONPUDRAFT_166202 [Coniophora puteana RWD-64-598 SS2]